MDNLTPKAIVKALDEHIVGQAEAKRAVAVALRNRWRRQRLSPELQGRLPIRVELKALTEEDFVRILSDTRASLTEQYRALLATEGVTIDFADDGIRALARIAAEVNGQVENIGARRLQTVLEKLLEDVSFEAEDRKGTTVLVDAAYVDTQLADIARNTDLSKYVL